MILVDTSVWVDHFRRGDAALADLLTQGSVETHPHIIGELALGSLASRKTVLALLKNLPAAAMASDAEVQHLIETRKLFGRGLGYVDAHLLASALLGTGRTIWTRDERLNAVADDLGLLQV